MHLEEQLLGVAERLGELKVQSISNLEVVKEHVVANSLKAEREIEVMQKVVNEGQGMHRSTDARATRGCGVDFVLFS